MLIYCQRMSPTAVFWQAKLPIIWRFQRPLFAVLFLYFELFPLCRQQVLTQGTLQSMHCTRYLSMPPLFSLNITASFLGRFPSRSQRGILLLDSNVALPLSKLSHLPPPFFSQILVRVFGVRRNWFVFFYMYGDVLSCQRPVPRSNPFQSANLSLISFIVSSLDAGL